MQDHLQDGCCELPDAHSSRLHWTDAARILLVAIAILVEWQGVLTAPAAFYVGMVSVLLFGYPIYKEALSALFERRMTMELSMTIALAAAVATAEVLTALIIVFFVLIAEELEKLTILSGRRSIKTLLDFLPRTATVRRGDSAVEIPLSSVAPGDIVIIRPGGAVCVDGTVTAGNSFVDEATITGESMPVEKLPGSQVFAGTMNQSGALEVRADRLGQETAFGKIVSAVERAEKTRANVQRLADRLAGYLVYFAIGSAAITLAVTQDIEQTISVIIVSGACGIAAGTPLAILGAIGRAAHKGSIIKGGTVLEALSSVDTVVFDKTGTLTRGVPHVVNVLPRLDVTPQAVLSSAATAESLSEHPIARAITRAAADASLPVDTPIDFRNLLGRGIVCHSAGEQIVVGNRALFAEMGIEEIDRHVPCHHMSEVLVARGGRMIGRIHVADPLRPEARTVVQELHRMGIRTVLMTGDNQAVSRTLAAELGLGACHAGLRPEDKKRLVADMQRDGARVAMVGDGINDAPALIEASVGVAVGSGTDVAVESADVVLIGNDLTRFVTALTTARQCRRIIMFNFAGTLIVDAIGMMLAFAGMLNPLLAALVHVGSEIGFLLNSARLFPFLEKHITGVKHDSNPDLG